MRSRQLSLKPLHIRSDLITLFAIGIIFFAPPVNARQNAIEFDVMWDASIGSTTVESIAQDARGFLWIGTQGGLVRYDGYEFVTIRNDRNDAMSLDDNFVRTILPSSDGRLWVGTVSGVNHYDPLTGSFARYRKPLDGTPEFLGTTFLVEYGSGLVVGSDTGLFILDPESEILKPFPDPPGGVAGEPISVVLVARDGALWVGTRFALHSKQTPNDEFQVELAAEDDESLVGILEDRAGKIWSRWSNGAIRVLDPVSDPKHGFGTAPSEQLGGNRFSWEAMIQPSDDEIWIGTTTGVVVLDSSTGSEKVKRTENLGTVQSLLVDESGVIWAGIAGMGLGRHVPANRAFTLVSEGLDVTNVGAAAEVKGAVWIGTRGAGIYIMNSKLADLVHLDVGSLTTPANDGLIRDILPVGDSVWVATNIAGIFRFDCTGKLLDRFAIADGLETMRTFTLANDSRGRIWVGTLDGGLVVIDPSERSVERVSFLDDDAAERHAPIIDLVIDSHDNVYVATEGSFVVIYEDGKRRRFTHEASDPESISHNGMTALVHDTKGRLWVGTRDGLNLMEPRPDGTVAFHRFGTKDGLPHGYIDGLLAGKNGEVWVATGLGLSRVDGDSFDFVTFDVNDGVPKGGFWIGGHHVRSNGTLLFASKAGLLMVDPEATTWAYRPKLAVTKVVVKGETVIGAAWRNLVLEPGRRDFSLEFAALDLSAPNRNRYSYRLDGYDDDWRQADAYRRVATYTNLDPGSYTLQIRGSNRAGLWSEGELAVPITVLPTYSEQWWFRVALLASALFVLWLAFRWRIRHLKSRERELERVVLQRTSELEKANIRLDHVSKTDYLTSLPNRRGFVEVAEREITRASRTLEPLCLALCDLDRFKHLNDEHGHDVGDFVLQGVARFLQDQIRHSDLVARWGGEEFLLLLPDTNLRGGRTITEKILENLRAMRFVHEGEEFEISATFGVSELETGMRLDECVKRADEALYEGKKEGGNRVVVWEE